MGRVSGSGAQLYTAIAVQLIPLEFYRLMAISDSPIFSKRRFDIGQREREERKKVNCCLPLFFSLSSPVQIFRDGLNYTVITIWVTRKSTSHSYSLHT